MTDRQRDRPIWCTNAEFEHILQTIEDAYGPEPNGLARGRAVAQLIDQRPSFRSGGAE